MSGLRAATVLIDELSAVLEHHAPLAIAISGGVDSTTLAAVAHRALKDKVTMVHAVSPAVPGEATQRVEHYASQYDWQLIEVNAGEFDDTDYRRNPVNRCYYCKSNLYSRIKRVWSNAIASGANLDDLGDYRPGLLAAKEKQVIHPLIEANIGKKDVRRMAAYLGLHQVAELPAQPCLSSRIETGISIRSEDLTFVHHIEKLLTARLGQGDIRCRITATGVRIEVPQSMVDANQDIWLDTQQHIEAEIISSGRGLSEFSMYRKGSAFLHEEQN